MGLFNKAETLLFLRSKAQGDKPWAFCVSLALHSAIVALLLSQAQHSRPVKSSASKRGAMSSRIVQLHLLEGISSTPVLPVAEALKTDPAASLIKGSSLPPHDHDAETISQDSPERPRIDNSKAGEAEVEAVLPLAMPSAISSGLASSRSAGFNPAFVMEQAQWQARRAEAFRQFSALERSFQYLPRPSEPITCIISATAQQCSDGSDIYRQLVASRLGFLFGIDPSFPTIEMRYEIAQGWYAVIPAFQPIR